MSFASLSLVVLAAFVHATWNLMSKSAAAAGPAFVFVYNIVACAAYAPWVLLLLAQGNVNWSWAVVICIAVSGLLHLGYSLCLQRGYRVADLSVVYPVARGAGPMLSSVGAFLILGEIPTKLGLSGLAFVVAGIALVSTQGDWSAFRKPKGQAGVGWGIITGALIASYTVVDAYGIKVLLIAPIILNWFGNLLRFALLAPLIVVSRGPSWELMRGKWGLAVGVGLLSPLSYILVLAALEMGATVSVVAPAREMSMMVVALLGMLILRERVRPWRLIGCAALIVGVLMLSAS